MTMLKLTEIALAVATLAACSPPPLCDREAQEWTKYGTQEDQCARGGYAPPSALDAPRQRPSIVTPDDPIVPVDPPGEDKPKRDHKDNGWGNGDDDAPGGSGSHNQAENEGGQS